MCIGMYIDGGGGGGGRRHVAPTCCEMRAYVLRESTVSLCCRFMQ